MHEARAFVHSNNVRELQMNDPVFLNDRAAHS